MAEHHAPRGCPGGSRGRRPRSWPAGVEEPGRNYAPRYNRRSYRNAVLRACLKAGVPAWSPLQLRHTAATSIRAQYGLEAAQTVLGHAKADTTLIYAERDMARPATIMREVG